MFNVIKLGSHLVKSSYKNRNVYIVRPYIQIPDTPIQKWGNSYISLHHFSGEEVAAMCKNGSTVNHFHIQGDFLQDRHNIVFIKAHKPVIYRETDYWITTITGIDYIPSNQDIILKDPDSKSHIFSIAYNMVEPIMFEATLILQKGDILVKDNMATEFCPVHNPFLTDWYQNR